MEGLALRMEAYCTYSKIVLVLDPVEALYNHFAVAAEDRSAESSSGLREYETEAACEEGAASSAVEAEHASVLWGKRHLVLKTDPQLGLGLLLDEDLP